ncbi:MAG: hypothetical protein AB1Z67_12055 [Candidatus Limnocylindrales bacterium]
MRRPAEDRRQLRLLAVVLTVLWAVTAVAIATAYRPGGPVDVLVALACFVPVAIADLGVIRPARKLTRRDRLALVWIWILAVLFVLPVIYGVASTVTPEGVQGLLPSAEAAYAGAVALYLMSWFSVVGLVHHRLGVRPLERRASVATSVVAFGLTAIAGLAFVFVAVVNERELSVEPASASRYGPTDPDLEPPFCDGSVTLGSSARVRIEATSAVDTFDRGTAVLEGQRDELDESWGGSWAGPDGSGQQAYLRVGRRAWVNDTSDDPQSPGRTWAETTPNPFGLRGEDGLTMDGPPHAVADAPRGAIVAEDLGLERIDGARARHCRTFIDGPTALRTFLPLRWLLANDVDIEEDALERWRGELDWWVFADGELGMATVSISGARGETGWDDDGVRAFLEARLQAVDRGAPMDVSAPVTAAE